MELMEQRYTDRLELADQVAEVEAVVQLEIRVQQEHWVK